MAITNFIASFKLFTYPTSLPISPAYPPAYLSIPPAYLSSRITYPAGLLIPPAYLSCRLTYLSHQLKYTYPDDLPILIPLAYLSRRLTYHAGYVVRSRARVASNFHVSSVLTKQLHHLILPATTTVDTVNSL